MNDILIQFEKMKAMIGGSSIVVCIITEHYLESPVCAMQLGMAVLYNRPIRLLVKGNLLVPDKLFKLAERIERFYEPADIQIASDRLLDDLKKEH